MYSRWTPKNRALETGVRGDRWQRRTILGLISILGASGLWGLPAQAEVPLTRASVAALRNRVELLPRGQTVRPAQLSDSLGLGDALRTAAASRAELRFNDGSLARVGERATFQFVPNTRNFRLSNGTVLLLIPPGQGRTTIQTPNTITGVQGSALVVRYAPDQEMTLVLALTDNPTGPMLITHTQTAQEVALGAGQIAMVKPHGIQIYTFDLDVFYQSSNLVQGLGLDDLTGAGAEPDALDAVRAETRSAIAAQATFTSDLVIDPASISLIHNAAPGVVPSPPRPDPPSSLIRAGATLIPPPIAVDPGVINSQVGISGPNPPMGIGGEVLPLSSLDLPILNVIGESLDPATLDLINLGPVDLDAVNLDNAAGADSPANP